MQFLKKFVLLLLLISSMSEVLARNVFYDSVRDPYVYGPTSLAILIALTDFDGKITDHASRRKPIYGTTENAKNISDILAFYIFPAYAGISTAIKTNRSVSGNSRLARYPSFLYGATATYFVNDFIKDKSGRLRPDNSNLNSFPSSHTALASSFSGFINKNNRDLIENRKTRSFVRFTNELLVLSVGWARLEAKKHHLTDVLVGYSIGKLFSNIFHKLLFDKNVNLNVMILNPQNISTGIVWTY